MANDNTHDRSRTLRKQMPAAERILWSCLRCGRMDGLHFRRQHPIGPFIADFACRKLRLTIEVDGASHWTEAQRAYDRRRTAYIRRAGWKELRVANDDVYMCLDRVLEHIWNEAHARTSCSGNS
ncbi:MAG: endonuclease domain-containing protein [Alphaproteobacteria bacterium]